MARSALPQNWFISPGTLLEDFETVGEWKAVTGAGAAAADEVNYQSGSKSLKISNVSGAATTTFYKTIDLDLSNVRDRGLSIWLYCHTAPSTTLTGFNVQMSSVASGSWGTSIKSSPALIDNHGHAGWNHIYVGPETWTVYGGESWDNRMKRLLVGIYAISGQSAQISFDSLYYGVKQKSVAILSHDHPYDSILDNAVPLANEYGAHLTWYVNTSVIGTEGYLSVEELQAVEAMGHTIANHTVNHPNLSESSEAINISEVQGAAEYLEANGFTNGAWHVCYPYTQYSATTLAVMQQLGIPTARAGGAYQQTLLNYHHQIPSMEAGIDDTLADVVNTIEPWRRSGYTINVHFHKILETASLEGEWSIEYYEGLLKYLRDAKVPCLTIDEWYNGLTNPRHRSAPVGRT